MGCSANVIKYTWHSEYGDLSVRLRLFNNGSRFILIAPSFLDKDCDLPKFNNTLQKHGRHSAIIMAGGGNFNDFYWEDQPSRINMVKAFPEVAIRAFPQSIHMTHADRIQQTISAFSAHDNLQLTARDAKSFSWLEQEFQKSGVKTRLLPDIAFMWGNRADIRKRVKKTWVP
jgi:exopolysaccharide biosynthesis predicted pyruvyltransferase EpsI